MTATHEFDLPNQSWNGIFILQKRKNRICFIYKCMLTYPWYSLFVCLYTHMYSIQSLYIFVRVWSILFLLQSVVFVIKLVNQRALIHLVWLRSLHFELFTEKNLRQKFSKWLWPNYTKQRALHNLHTVCKYACTCKLYLHLSQTISQFMFKQSWRIIKT